MQYLITGDGTRGDLEPMIAVGKMLKNRGHNIVCLFPEKFKKLVEDAGIQFDSLGAGLFSKTISDLKKSYKSINEIELNTDLPSRENSNENAINERILIEKQYLGIVKWNPDRIIHNFNTLVPLFWEIQSPGKTILLSVFPYLHYVKGHPLFTFHRNFGSLINPLTYVLFRYNNIQTVLYACKILNFEGFSRKKITKALKSQKAIYTISPQLFKRPEYWGDHIKVVGFHERDKIMDWKPDSQLQTFLSAHDKILFVTFGSMLNPNPSKRTQIILNILKRRNIPAIINTYAGGLEEPDDYDQNLFYFVSSIPYEWIFPRVYAALHHGGSGTTHMAIKYGCPSLIIPHMGDQFAWNQLIFEKKLGPKGLRIKRISEINLEPKILELMNNEQFKDNAVALGERMKSENYLEEELVNMLTQ